MKNSKERDGAGPGSIMLRPCPFLVHLEWKVWEDSGGAVNMDLG